MTIKVETSQRIGRPVADLFEAWVDPGKMAGYFISNGTARMEPGKTVRWSWDDHGDAELDIEVQSVEAYRKLAFRWSASGVPTNVTVDFHEEPDGTTRVTVCEDGWEADAEGVGRYGEQMQGWVHMLASLKVYLEYEQINLRHTPSGPYDLQVDRGFGDRVARDRHEVAWPDVLAHLDDYLAAHP